MASSRLERIGTIYTRVRGLLRSGAMKQEDKPVWYDVYEAFPPKIEPFHGRKVPDMAVRNILYPEDIIRAKFYERYGSSGQISLTNKYPTPCQNFLDKYREMEKDYADENELFEAVVKVLQEEKSMFSSSNEQQSRDTSMASMFTSVNKEISQKSKINIADVLSEK
ncbi:probable 28S ribosomal protein S23, mitochondrial [Daphnia pulicaria]|uniref:probable 28S ribosomal protein S23, mitochondrial n=1 Tax=Daphnia pulicaria TaxID=35523 RepID=UPI001EEB3E9D|nr:probable 28S ribosomal protein S23, mitochondrial [Daphnia pulicaria]